MENKDFITNGSIFNELIKATNILRDCRDALLNAQGTYEFLKHMSFAKDLPGLGMCEKNASDAIRAIESHFKEYEIE